MPKSESHIRHDQSNEPPRKKGVSISKQSMHNIGSGRESRHNMTRNASSVASLGRASSANVTYQTSQRVIPGKSIYSHSKKTASIHFYMFLHVVPKQSFFSLKGNAGAMMTTAEAVENPVVFKSFVSHEALGINPADILNPAMLQIEIEKQNQQLNRMAILRHSMIVQNQINSRQSQVHGRQSQNLGGRQSQNQGGRLSQNQGRQSQNQKRQSEYEARQSQSQGRQSENQGHRSLDDDEYLNQF